MVSITKDEKKDFIRTIIEKDNRINKWGGYVKTRFPPEPNGFLHIGHAKSIILNYEIAYENEGVCNLRFDDTNPERESRKYIESIKDDLSWLGYDHSKYLFYASDYFEQLYEYAVCLIKKGKAYVCDLSLEEIREYRGTLRSSGKNSPYRNRTIEENLDLFQRMRQGEFKSGDCTLRAKIDMTHNNLVMRDPVLYRIKSVKHYRTGIKWCIYPMYDFTHCISDSIEKITHSICTLEFRDNRELYEWILKKLEMHCPQQIEFARLNLEYNVMSKRILSHLVEKQFVKGWDDPRMPTISGMRRRGFTPDSIRSFCKIIGVAKRDSLVDIGKLDWAVRNDLNLKVPRIMAVVNPLKLVIDNYPEDMLEEIDAPYFPDDPEKMGYRKVFFSKELYVEREDFMEKAPKKFWRLTPGQEVRLRWAYFVTCTSVVKDSMGQVTEIHCEYDPKSKGGTSPDGRKVKGTIHWVSVEHSLQVKVNLYDQLFLVSDLTKLKKDSDFREYINDNSLRTFFESRVEKSILDSFFEYDRYQFERKGYFYLDPISSIFETKKLVFNRIVTLRDSWKKTLKKIKKSDIIL